MRPGGAGVFEIHFRHLYVPLRGIFGPNSFDADPCAAFIWARSPIKRGAQMTKVMFKHTPDRMKHKEREPGHEQKD